MYICTRSVSCPCWGENALLAASKVTEREVDLKFCTFQRENLTLAIQATEEDIAGPGGLVDVFQYVFIISPEFFGPLCLIREVGGISVDIFAEDVTPEELNVCRKHLETTIADKQCTEVTVGDTA